MVGGQAAAPDAAHAVFSASYDALAALEAVLAM
jgi:hypothetical protein